MAITFTRTMRSAAGKQMEARQWAAETTAYVNSLGVAEMHVHAARFGDLMQIGFSAQFESLAAFEAAQAKILADAKYQQIVTDVRERGLFENTIVDQIWDQLV